MKNTLFQSTSLPARSGIAHAVRDIALTSAEFERLRDLLASFGGVYLDTARQRVLEQAVTRRVRLYGGDLAHYEHELRTNREELGRLAELVLNHETYFFRNQPHMRALRDVLLPELHRRKPWGEPIRIWSAGCATGEEPYSLAIVALEAVSAVLRPIEIIGTDLSEPALSLAREGCYSGRSLTNVSPELLARHFVDDGDSYRVGERLRSMVRFERYNLLDEIPAYLRGVDIIFCQNVIIYFQALTSRAILGRFYELLPEGGMLFLGFSETLWNMFDAFRTREVQGAFVYYKETQALTTRPRETRSANELRPAKVARPPSEAPLRTPAVPPARRETRQLTSVPKSTAAGDAALLQQGQQLLLAGRADEALSVLGHITPRSTVAAAAMTLVARAHADRGQIDLAVAEAQRVIEIDPLDDEATLLLGVLYGRQGLWDTAALQLERARYLNNSAPLISFHLAEAYRRLQRKEAAIREYRSTLRKLEPHPPDTVFAGVAIGWLRETCQRHIAQLGRDGE